jgi:negative regulator of flagellin synthesis FlgM
MRVTNQPGSPASNAEIQNSKKTERSAQVRKESAGAERAADKGGAQASISAKAKDFVQARSIASDAPDIREEKIAELKRRIASGGYKVDADEIADRMVDEHIKSGIG